jgi:hypothetical protein
MLLWFCIVISFLAVVAAIRAIISERRERKKNLQRWEKTKNEMDKKVKNILYCYLYGNRLTIRKRFDSSHSRQQLKSSLNIKLLEVAVRD